MHASVHVLNYSTLLDHGAIIATYVSMYIHAAYARHLTTIDHNDLPVHVAMYLWYFLDSIQSSLLEDPTDEGDGENESEETLNMKRYICLVQVSTQYDINLSCAGWCIYWVYQTSLRNTLSCYWDGHRWVDVWVMFHLLTSLRNEFFSLQQTSSSAGCVSRVRALQILFTISPPSMIERVSGKPIANIR